MALRITKKPTDYISESAYVYDVAKTSKYFDKSVYDGLVSSGNNDDIEQYIYGIAGSVNKTSLDFNENDYRYLSTPEDKASYVLWSLYGDKTETAKDESTGETYNVWQRQKEYFDAKIQEGIDKETYESLNGFERTIASIGGIVGNALNETILGTVEGLVDLGAVLVGQKEWAAKDFTGVAANRKELQRFARAYTYLDKNKVWGVANDVVTGISQMVPMITLNAVAPGLGSTVYFGAMAGNTAAEAVRANPDIDYLSLMGYTIATTGVEFATERLSAHLLGGTGNFIDSQILGSTAGKGVTKLGQKAASNWIYRVGLNFLSEGLEESIAEFADTALFNVFIAQGNDDLRKTYSVEDIIYAGIIGGLIGGVMEGGRISLQPRLSIANDGSLINTKNAKKLGIDTSTDLTKLQSITLTEQLSQAKTLIQTDAVADLQNKYPSLTLEEIRKLHTKEYEKALEKNEKLSKNMTEIALGLSRVYSLIGDEGFKRAVDLVNGTFENRRTLLQNYLEAAEGFTKRKQILYIEDKINKAIYNEYGKGVVFNRQRTGLTARQLRLQQNLKNRYGIDVYFGSFGVEDGANRKFGLTISESEIVLDEKQFGEMSDQEILNKVVKEELVHTMQFTKGIITPRTLLEINRAMGDIAVNKQNLNEAYAQETGLTKLSEAQAKAIAEVLLFDELTVSKMFYTQYSTLNKVYKFFKNIKTKLEESKTLRSQKGKMKYNTLLKSMRMYREIAAQKLGNIDNVEQFIKDYQLTELEQKQLRDTYLENPEIGPVEGFEVGAFSKTIRPKELIELLKPSENEELAINLLKEYLSEPKSKITISSQNGNYIVMSGKGKSPKLLFTANNITDLTTRLQDNNLITNDMVDLINSVLENGLPEGPIQVTTIAGQQKILAEQYQEPQRADVKPNNKTTSSLAYVQTDIFDYLEETLNEAERMDTLNKAVEQENNSKKIEDSVLKSKSERILKIFDNRDVSLFQGDVDDPEVERVSDELFDEHPEAFADITPDEFMALKDYFVVRIGTDPVYGAATNALIRYGWLNRDTQFKSINEYVKSLYAQWIATGAQAIGLTSSDYETTISSFLKQLAKEHGVTNITLPNELFLKVTPKIDDLDSLSNNTQKDIDSLNKELSEAQNETQRKNITEKLEIKKSLLNAISKKDDLEIFKQNTLLEITDLKEKVSGTKDPLDKRDLLNIIRNKQMIVTMLDEGEIASAIDRQLKLMFEDGTNITDTLQLQSTIYQAIIEHLIKNSEFENNKLIGVSGGKVPLSENMKKAKNFFMGLESFRYMMMLSNPATAFKNFASNTLILAQSLVEDGVLKLYEKSNILTQAAQGKYTGDYDATFKKYIKNKFYEKIKHDSEGDKYTSTELKRLQQKYAEAKDPLAKNKLLSKIQAFERKMLSDKLHVAKRTLMNLTNTLAGTSDMILNQSIDYLKTKYLTKNELATFNNNLESKQKMVEKLTTKIRETNEKVADTLEKALKGDKVAILELADAADLDIIKPDLKNDKSIYYNAFKRANKTFFKIDNYFTKMISNLNKTHPAAAYIVRHFIPFVRVAANTTQYIIDRSPIGLVKGVKNWLQTKRKWAFEMREAIDGWYKQQFYKERTSETKPTPEEYKEWFNNLGDYEGISATKLKQAMNGDDKLTKQIFEQMVNKGMVAREQIGSNDLFARADIVEQFAQGTVGTATMVLGFLLAAVLDFEYDEEDYLGPVINIKGFKIALDELSPFTTLFTIGAMLNSDVDNKHDVVFQIFADASILSTFDSALAYSDGVWDYLKNQSINIVTQYQPALTKAIAKVVHNKKKDKGTAYGEKLLNSIMMNTLAFNWAVPNKINPYTGEPEKYYDTGWVEALTDTILPIGLRITNQSIFEKEAKRFKAKTTGLSGNFEINDKKYSLTGKTKQKYAAYKANYIESRFEQIYTDNEKVTIKDEKTGKYKTVEYSQLTDEEKTKVLKNIYSTGTTITKIKYWLDKGNSYVVTDKNQYREYKNIFGNSAKIVYQKKWSGSKFVEG